MKDLVGKVVHYYDKILVVVIKLEKGVKTGDKLKFVHGDNVFEQTVESMQFEHEQITQGKKGQEIALKVDKEAVKGTLVYLA
jgi:translation elongation factor EF-1alpha